MRRQIIERQTILAIDPGSAKSGIAVVSGPSPFEIHYKSVATSDKLVRTLSSILDKYEAVSAIIVGNGTSSVFATSSLKELFPSLPVIVVEEHGTSQRARKRFIAEEPASFFQRLLPPGLRSPSRPYDDYVAVILGEEFFESRN